MGKINSKKAIYNGIEFDSSTEKDYYIHLLQQGDIENITIQPEYTLIEPFSVACGRCISGKTISESGNTLKCRTCKGTGKRRRRPTKYTADFEVRYIDGRTETIDVKGFANERFNYIRKLFELKYGKELIVIKRDKEKGWVRK